MLSYFLQPKVSVQLRRLGSKNDGGYFVPKKIIPLAENLICFGLGFNWGSKEVSSRRPSRSDTQHLSIHLILVLKVIGNGVRTHPRVALLLSAKLTFGPPTTRNLTG